MALLEYELRGKVALLTFNRPEAMNALGELGDGDAVINPRNVWHTADIAEPCRMLFITPGRGTEHKPR